MYELGRSTVLGIATRYGVDSSGIVSSLDRPWGPLSPLYNGYRVSFLEINRPERGVDHLPPYNAEVKERVELYLYTPLGLHSVFWGELYFLSTLTYHNMMNFTKKQLEAYIPTCEMLKCCRSKPRFICCLYYGEYNINTTAY